MLNESVRERLLHGMPVYFEAGRSESERQVESEWIERAATSGLSIDLRYAVVNGTIQLKHATVAGAISLIGCECEDWQSDFAHFERDVDLGLTRFKGPMNSRCASFDQEVRLQGTRFDSECDISDIDVHHCLCADSSEFAADINAHGLRVGRSLIFRKTKFHGATNFAGSRIAGFASFSDSVFDKRALFNGLKIDEGLILHGAHFEQSAAFDRVCTGGDLNVNDALFLDASFNNLRVTGDLECKRAVFAEHVRFTGSVVSGSATFQSSTFKNAASLDGSRVDGALNLTQTTFGGRLTAKYMQVGRDIDMTDCRCSGDVCLDGLAAGADITLDKAEFKADVRCLAASAKGQFQLEGARFSKKATFDGLTAGQGFYGDGARFEDDARFMVSEIGEDLDISHAIFAKDVVFDRSQVETNLFAEKTHVGGEASMVGMKVGGQAKVFGAEFVGKWDLRWSEFGVLRLCEPNLDAREDDYREIVHAKVDLRGCTYGHIVADWGRLIEQQDPFDFQPYNQLEQVLRRSGHDDEADLVYKAGHRRHGDAMTIPWPKFFTGKFWRNAFGVALDRAWRFVGYGVNPAGLLGIVAITILLGAVLYHLPNAVCAVGESARCDNVLRLHWGEALWYAISTFSPIDFPTRTKLLPTDSYADLVGLPTLTVAVYSALIKLTGWTVIPTLVATLAGLLRHRGNGS